MSESLRILLIDDSELLLRALKRVLRYRGHQVVALSEAQLALSYLECTELGVDVILCDADMPNMTGMQFLEKLRERDDPHAEKFIFHTNRTAHEHGYSTRYEGVLAVSRKGDYDAILRAIEELQAPKTDNVWNLAENEQESKLH